MSVLKYFKNIPRSPPHRATGLKCKFFFQNRNEVPGKKSPVAPQRATGACRPAHGRPAAGPNPRAAGGPVAPPVGDRGGLSPPRGRPGCPPIKGPALPFPPHLSPKIPPKIQKKREEWGEGKRRSPAGFSTCDLQVSTFSLYIVIFNYYIFKYE